MERLILCALGLAIVSGPAQAETTFRITIDQAGCIAENVEKYFGYGTDPVIVVPESCPNPPTNDELMAALATQNSGFPTPKEGEGDKVLILLRSQLRCIRDMVSANTLPAARNGLVEISLDNCGE